MISLIQHFEADFLWKVSLKILKTFAHAVKPVLSCHSKDQKKVFKNDNRLMQIKSIAECSLGAAFCNIKYHMAFRPLFCLFFEWPHKTGFTVFVTTKVWVKKFKSSKILNLKI